MEFLRFGGRINGAYWGCCAVDIIQNFKVDPDTKYSRQIVFGDSNMATGQGFAGTTYRGIFETMLRIGTHSGTDKPCRSFLAILTETQLQTETGKKWLAILKENGFEFIRTVHNSVYGDSGYSHPNYLFGLFRNTGKSAIADPFTPPSAWTALPEPTKTAAEIYNEGKTTFYKEAELIAAKVPIVLSGKTGAPPSIKTVAKDGTTATASAIKYDPYAIHAQEQDLLDQLDAVDVHPLPGVNIGAIAGAQLPN